MLEKSPITATTDRPALCWWKCFWTQQLRWGISSARISLYDIQSQFHYACVCRVSPGISASNSVSQKPESKVIKHNFSLTHNAEQSLIDGRMMRRMLCANNSSQQLKIEILQCFRIFPLWSRAFLSILLNAFPLFDAARHFHPVHVAQIAETARSHRPLITSSHPVARFSFVVTQTTTICIRRDHEYCF